MKKLLLIDGNSIANRAYYALPFLSNEKGHPSGAVFGFATLILKLLNEQKPDYVAVAFDHARKTFRNEIYSEYKMQRKPSPHELIMQFPIIKQLLNAMEVQYFEQNGIEADDIIGTLSKSFKGETIILSGDRDLFQLIDHKTSVWFTRKGVSEIDVVDEERLYELFALKPFQVVELKGLMGDASDNIPGVKGVGEKTAVSLIEQYETIDDLYNNIDKVGGKLGEKLLNNKEMAYMSKLLATIKTDCALDVDFEKCRFSLPYPHTLLDFFKEWNFTTLLNEKISFKQPTVKAKVYEKVKMRLQDFENSKNVTEFCYDLKTLEFCINGKIYYLEKNYSLFETPISLEDICLALKDIFEDENVLKISKNIKEDMHILSRFGISLKNYFDLSLAEYVVLTGVKITTDYNVAEFSKKKKDFEREISRKGLKRIFYDIEMPLVKLLFEMEQNGFKLNANTLDDISVYFGEKLETLKKQIYLEAGEEFNINSPKQVAHILFDKLGIENSNNKKQSTRANKLDDIRHIPIVDNILTYRKYSKLINTYVEVYQNHIKEKGDIIHTTFNQTLTNTGRLSSSEPNLQNIPTRDDDGRVLRKIFISKFDNGKIISADYSQIELRLLADMSGEEKLIEAYMNGDDIHAATASEIFNIPINKVTQSNRRDAKAINFGIIYGISEYGLSQSIKSSRVVAKNYIDAYFDKYPKVKQFMDENVKKAYNKGHAVTKWGRIRLIPELSSSKYFTKSFGERVAMNMPLQGTASDIIKYAMLKVDKKLKDNNLKSQLILQIHDELVIDTYPGEEDVVVSIIKDEMENAITLNVPLTVSIGMGESLFDCK